MRYIVVGCGITGATIARNIAERGKKVEVWDRRNHVAGNMYDHSDEYGIMVHEYGPHIFHTNSEKVWDYVNRFEEWQPFKLICGAKWDGKYTPTAFNFKTIDTFFPHEKAEILKSKIAKEFDGRKSATVVEVLENEDPDIREYAEYLFENDYGPYTAKQWGVTVEEIDVSVLKRVPLRFTYEEAYFSDKYEAMPVHSYTYMIKKMLDHPNITVELGIDALTRLKIVGDRIIINSDNDEVMIVYTGALDELFGCKYGELPYRSLRFEWKHDNIDSFQEAPVVAYPKEPRFTRITEYKKLPPQKVNGTTYAIEYPIPYISGEKIDPYYPVLTEKSIKQFKLYESEAKKIGNLVCCGRLANFKYYNMDEAILSAMAVACKDIK